MGCPIATGPSTATQIVENGWDTWGDFAQDAFRDAQEFVGDLAELDIQPVPINIQFDVPADLGSPFTKPPAPVDPNLSYGSVEGPGSLALTDLTPIAFDTAPVDDTQRPSLNIPAAPDALSAAEPGDAPDLTAVTVPDAPELTLPDLPTFEAINLPAVPTVTLPTFDEVAPESDLVAPGDTFLFEEEEYNSALLTGIQGRVTTMLAGGTGLPDAIWNQIWDRARSNEERTAGVAIRQASEDWAARGWSIPPGALSARIAEARQKAQDAHNTFNREVAIQQVTQEQENLRFAVTQGVALESVLVGLHNSRIQRALQAAQFAFQAGVDIFNARIALFNTELQAYATKAQVFRDRIQAELARIEVYRAQLEGQRIIGELNRQAVELYNAQVQGLLANVELYRAQVQGVQAQVDVDRNRVEAFRAVVEAYGERVRAKSAEFQAYGEQVRAELAKTEIYRAEVAAFNSRVEAYRTGTEARVSQKRIELDTNNQRVQEFQARIEKYRADIQGESERIRAGVGIYQGKAELYAAELSAEQARVVADSRQFELALTEGRARADLELRKGELKVEQVLRLLTLEQESRRILAQVQSQLAAAAMSAVNLSAGISSSSSDSSGCTTSYSYSGDA